MEKSFVKIGRTEIRNIIAVLYITLVLIFIYVLGFHAVPPGNKDLINVLGGVVIGGVGTILSYYFGSSKSQTDAAKNDITKIETTTSTIE